MRSKLFVPGSRPELFAKALAGQADAISLDLEDSVSESTKAAARAQVASFLAETAHQLYVTAENMGYGERYVARMIDVMLQLNGITTAKAPPASRP